MLTVQQVNQLRNHGITSLELLSVLLATKHAVWLADLCFIANVSRRTIEKMCINKPDLLQRLLCYEKPGQYEGSPRSKVIIRTEKANRILNQIFGQNV